MATEGLEIRISANVNQAVAGLDKVQKSTVAAGQALTKFTPQVGNANTTLVNFGRVVQDAPFGLIGIANNIDPLISSFQQLRTQTGSAGAAFRALGASLLGPAGIVIGVSAVTSALIAFGPQIKNFIFGTKEASKSQQAAADAIAGNYTQVLLLTEAYKRSQNSLEERRNIVSQLNSISSEYFGKLSAEKTTVDQLKVAYDAYIDNLLRSFAVKQLEQDLEPLIKRLATAQLTIKTLNKDVQTLGLQNVDLRNLTEQQRAALSTSGITAFNAAKREEGIAREEINKRIERATVLTVGNTKAIKDQNKAIKEGIKEQEKLFEFPLVVERRPQVRQQEDLANALRLPRRAEFGEAQNALVRFRTEFEALREANLRYRNELQDTITNTINNGLNASIDQFFNALANNQDPFKALTQSLQRFVFELGAAIAKTLVLQAVANSIAPGSGQALSAGQKLLVKNFEAGNLRFR